MPAIPFLTTYDPAGSSEGTLDPLGLYQVADQPLPANASNVFKRLLRAEEVKDK